MDTLSVSAGSRRILAPEEVDREAARIKDPVERLRYLRHQARLHAAAREQPNSSWLTRAGLKRFAKPETAAGRALAFWRDEAWQSDRFWQNDATRPYATRQQQIATETALAADRAKRPSWLPRGQVGVALLAVAVIGVVAAWPTGTPQVAANETRLPIPGAAILPDAELPSPNQIWMVEDTETTEVYSNGLRVDLSFTTKLRPREYPIFSNAGSADPIGIGREPRGIVFHTTESDMLPFEEDANKDLKRLGRNLLGWLRTEQAYHYLIDRFGRVYRLVDETDAANHAGFSVWGDAEGLYVNLNDSFLGVAFEAQTGSQDLVTAAQITSARMLTEMLRDRYGIAAENCVTHAQVSVNPDNMKIAAHTDWARGFPFAALGLPNNYRIAPPSLYAFGFAYDDFFLNIAREKWPGLDLADRQVTRQARQENTTEVRYKAILQRRYKEIRAVLKQQRPGGV